MPPHYCLPACMHACLLLPASHLPAPTCNNIRLLMYLVSFLILALKHLDSLAAEQLLYHSRVMLCHSRVVLYHSRVVD